MTHCLSSDTSGIQLSVTIIYNSTVTMVSASGFPLK